jgi:hypothetical protein
MEEPSIRNNSAGGPLAGSLHTAGKNRAHIRRPVLRAEKRRPPGRPATIVRRWESPLIETLGIDVGLGANVLVVIPGIMSRSNKLRSRQASNAGEQRVVLRRLNVCLTQSGGTAERNRVQARQVWDQLHHIVSLMRQAISRDSIA